MSSSYPYLQAQRRQRCNTPAKSKENLRPIGSTAQQDRLVSIIGYDEGIAKLHGLVVQVAAKVYTSSILVAENWALGANNTRIPLVAILPGKI